jgi:hypothetical protein
MIDLNQADPLPDARLHSICAASSRRSSGLKPNHEYDQLGVRVPKGLVFSTIKDALALKEPPSQFDEKRVGVIH